MAYRASILSSEAAANGDICLDVIVESDRTGSWALIQNGHRTLVLDGSAVLAITSGAGTAAQKRTALSNLFKSEVLLWGLDEADDANQQLAALVTYPVIVSLS